MHGVICFQRSRDLDTFVVKANSFDRYAPDYLKTAEYRPKQKHFNPFLVIICCIDEMTLNWLRFPDCTLVKIISTPRPYPTPSCHDHVSSIIVL